MKKKITFLVLSALMFGTFISTLKSQDSLSVLTGADIYSNYIWRGSKIAGVSMQPSVKFIYGGLTAGVWGSYGLKQTATGLGLYVETDPYVSYTLPIGLSVGATDYYYEGDFSNLSDTLGSHAFEANVGYTLGSLSLSANYIFNKAPGAGSIGKDTYVQAGYTFSKFNIFLGAGNGWHTADTKFAVCNVGIGSSKTISVTDKFSIPVTGQFVVNPDKKQIFFVVGFTL